MAVCIFLLVKVINKMKKPEPAAPAAPARKCPYCMGEIDPAATRCPIAPRN
jgi:large conductance mechanosensitive channel